MLNFWFSRYDEICSDNYNYSRFKLKDKCRSEKWELYLYGDKTIQARCCDDRAWGPDVQKTVVLTVAVLGSSWFDGMIFWGRVHRYTARGFPPPSGRGRGGGDAGSLLPGVLPPN